MHKPDALLQGRTVVATIGSLENPIGILMDTLLQPLVNRIPFHLLDFKHTIQVFEGLPWSENKKWLTCDVRSLYSSIPHTLGFQSLKHHMDFYTEYSLI